MSGFGSLYVGVSGLKTSQDALNTTAHNLSNIETKGYVRQVVTQEDRNYSTIGNAAISSLQVGLGVNIADVRQVRDFFLDQQYRKEAGRSAYYQACYEAAYETEGFFHELDGETYQSCLDSLWESVAELSKTPESKVNKEYFVLKASEFLKRSTAIYESLNEYQDNLNQQVTNKIKRINELGDIIKYTNDKIVGVELGGAENANDYRDARNAALDELAELANISYETDTEGFVTVKLEGTQFVNRDMVNKMSYTTDTTNGFYTPVWPQEGNAPVFDLSLEVSTENDSNVGSLKAILMARGDHRANYTDIDALNQAVKDGTMTKEQASAAYDKNIGGSVVMKAQAEFDQLVHGIVTMINDTLCMDEYAGDGNGPSAELFIRIGEVERYQKDANGDYVVGADGCYVPIEEENYIVDSKGNYHAVGENSSKYNSLYTAGNLMINPAVLANSGLLEFKKINGQTNYNMADMMIEKWNGEFSTLNPTEESRMNYSDYYAGFMSSLSNTIGVYQGIAEGQEKLSNSIDSSRAEVMGVSSDEELSNMIRYQNAYNASSRYINVVNEMLEYLVTSL